MRMKPYKNIFRTEVYYPEKRVEKIKMTRNKTILLRKIDYVDKIDKN